MLPGQTGATAGQAPSDAQPQAGTTSTGQAPAGTGQPAPEAGSGTEANTGTGGEATGGETAEARADRLDRENAELRREQAANRTKLRGLETAAAQAAQAGMTEAERAAATLKALQDQNAELQGRLTDQAIEASSAAAAAKLNFRNPELAVRLLDRSALEFDDSGRPKNVEKQLRELAQKEPYLVKGAGADFGGGNQGATPSGEPDMNTLLRAAFKGG